MTPMLTGCALVRTATSALKRPASLHEQVRFRKQIRLNYGYGMKPLFGEDEYMEAKERGLERLAFEKVRFNRLFESHSPLIDQIHEKFCCTILRQGKRALVYHLMNETFYKIKTIQLKKFRKHQQQEAEAKAAGKEFEPEYAPDEIETNPMTILNKAIENAKPLLITRKVRRGGAIYQVPFPISASESERFGMKWIEEAVKDRPKPREKSFEIVMASELIDAAMNRGKVVKRRDDVHKLAAANRAYSHYRWG